MIDSEFTSQLKPLSSCLPLATDTAIQHLRTEIIAADWQLSPQRISRLRAAFASLSSFFTNQSHALALLKMAISAVDHIDQQGSQAKAMDFLKEAMAHIVSIYEDDTPDPGREKALVSQAYKRFLRLNIPLGTGRVPAAQHGQNTSKLLAALETLSHEMTHLPGLLGQAGPLSPEEREKAAAHLATISAAIKRAWAQLPSAPQ